MGKTKQQIREMRKAHELRVNIGGLTFPKYRVFYAKKPTFTLDKNNVAMSFDYAYVMTVHTVHENQTAALEAIYRKMQGDQWSPEGEARDLIQALGLHHTSMSVGDLIQDAETGRLFGCAMAGFEEISGMGFGPEIPFLVTTVDVNPGGSVLVNTTVIKARDDFHAREKYAETFGIADLEEVYDVVRCERLDSVDCEENGFNLEETY